MTVGLHADVRTEHTADDVEFEMCSARTTSQMYINNTNCIYDIIFSNTGVSYDSLVFEYISKISIVSELKKTKFPKMSIQ